MPTIPLGPPKLNASFNPASQFLLIAGPCVIESLDLCLTIAGTVKELCAKLSGTHQSAPGSAGGSHASSASTPLLPFIFKASFDKANRSSAKSHRGVDMDKGLQILAAVRDQIGVPVTTDIHESDQATHAAHAVDMLQIPAFLCRQTDLLLAAGQTGKPVNIKKGQFMAPWEMANALEKVASTGNPHTLLTERGTFFGYNRLVNDFTGIPQMQALGATPPASAPGSAGGTTSSGRTNPTTPSENAQELQSLGFPVHTPVLMDATHSTQLPGGLGHATAGQRQFVPLLARAATAAGVNGLFIEVHPTPEKSPSDAATILNIKDLPQLLEQCLAIRQALHI